jgi:integrase
MHHRLQRGRLFKKNGSWHAEFYKEARTGTGEVAWRQTSSAIGRIDEFPRQRDIKSVFDGFMDRINDQYDRIHSGDPPLVAFIEQTYLCSQYVLALSHSTIAEYQGMWKRYLHDHLQGETLSSVRPVTVNNLLESIVKKHGLSKTTIQHIKAFLSGVCSFARNHGHFDGANPVTGVKLPKAHAEGETYAYDLDEERAIMDVVDLMPKAAIATASYAGLSKSEMQGLCWEDRSNGSLNVQRKVWNGIVGDVKTTYRKAPVPIIPQLADVLDMYWVACGKPAKGWVWPASRGKLPMDLNNLYRRHIQDSMEVAKLTWHGWHAFRRGLASNLSALGVPDNVIQQILRHGDLSTTQRFYRKTRRPAVKNAMQKLSRKLATTDKQRTRKSIGL